MQAPPTHESQLQRPGSAEGALHWVPRGRFYGAAPAGPVELADGDCSAIPQQPQQDNRTCTVDWKCRGAAPPAASGVAPAAKASGAPAAAASEVRGSTLPRSPKAAQVAFDWGPQQPVPAAAEKATKPDMEVIPSLDLRALIQEAKRRKQADHAAGVPSVLLSYQPLVRGCLHTCFSHRGILLWRSLFSSLTRCIT